VPYGRLQRERSQRHPAAQEEPRSPRYAVTTVTAGCEQERGEHREGVNYTQPSDVSSSKAGAAGQAHLQPAVLSSCPSPLPDQLGAAHAQSGGPYQTSLRPDVPAFVPLGPQQVAQTSQLQASQQLQAMESSGGGAAVEPVSTLAATPYNTLSMALLAQQLPSLPCFSGEHTDGDGENFTEWLELCSHNDYRVGGCEF